MTKLLIEVYARKDCTLCDSAKDCVLCRDVKDIIDRVGADIPFQFKEVDIDANEDLLRRFNEDIPTVFINGKKAFKFKVDESELRKKLRKELIKAGLKRLWNKKQHYS
ncbi:MAG: glutaredoxin family protein [Deltaproteobacteria bacterium]|nr:glutaredoxin family protein [Deltaproteobacteria bacterium]